MNIKLLQAVKQAILEAPRWADMFCWGLETGCGTVGCIASWTQAIGTGASAAIDQFDYDGRRLQVRAAELLGISLQEAGGLFIPDNWPVALRYELYSTTERTPDHAAVIAKAIELFIESPWRFKQIYSMALPEPQVELVGVE